jgi:hypothetical protein
MLRSGCACSADVEWRYAASVAGVDCSIKGISNHAVKGLRSNSPTHGWPCGLELA